MNFLAHIYLSGEDEDLQFGNFIADTIRGKHYQHFSSGIQKGIVLHRAIDSFTDQHLIFRQHCKLFFPDHGHYARVIMDVLYDHFLAAHWELYHPDPLEDFVAAFYKKTAERSADIPLKMLPLFKSMQQQNWLVQYASIDGLENILKHMSKRTSFPAQFDSAIPLIKKGKEQMLPQFNAFFKELCVFSKNHSILGD